MTEQELRDYLAQDLGATIVTIHTLKPPKMRKTNNPFMGRVIKRSRVNGVIHFNWASVTRNRTGEAYKPGPLPFGQHDPDVPGIIHYQGKMYLQILVQNREVHYFADDEREIEVDKLKPFLIDDGELEIATYRFETIEAIKIKGQFLTITH